MNARRLPTSSESFFTATRTALLGWARGDGLAWLHIFKTVLAALLVMGLSMRIDLPSPRTAMVTVFIVMQPQTGMVLAKSFYRFAGTIIGAVVTITITAVFGQVPELFLLSIAIWIGVCTFGAALNRNFRAYGFVLSGYTTALIGIPALAHPDGVFLAATTRVSELSMGIFCSAIVSSIVFPQRVADTLRDVVRARYSRFTQLVTETFSGASTPESAKDFHARFAADVVALEALSSVAVARAAVAAQAAPAGLAGPGGGGLHPAHDASAAHPREPYARHRPSSPRFQPMTRSSRRRRPAGCSRCSTSATPCSSCASNLQPFRRCGMTRRTRASPWSTGLPCCLIRRRRLTSLRRGERSTRR
ncbi:hypothetical protein DLM46_17000 [Paraburkholderia lacunae]|uniref:FUSC family protein n=1 Tax=Paraburkholderia lacunae TaxID=2211104 RepID=A0A370N7H3_9BURK|nr:hypothetical protein DLM46_17000 [Paraburkholderia lacunae]